MWFCVIYFRILPLLDVTSYNNRKIWTITAENNITQKNCFHYHILVFHAESDSINLVEEAIATTVYIIIIRMAARNFKWRYVSQSDNSNLPKVSVVKEGRATQMEKGNFDYFNRVAKVFSKKSFIIGV